MKLDLDNLSGTVAIVGAGPGDPELMTLRAHRLLARADVVLCDRLVHGEILQPCRDDVRFIDVGKSPDGKRTSQDVINHLLVKEARGGNFVVRLKGGDPFVFGRGGEEALHLRKHGVDFEIVPGISSCVGVPERAGIPVTHRGVSTHFTVVTGMGTDGPPEEAWRKLAGTGGTLVVLMGVRQLKNIVAALVAGGRDPRTPAAIVQEGTTPNQLSVEGTLATIAERAEQVGVSSPAVIIIGDVVSLRQKIAGREKPWPALQTVLAG